jgi:hypothetical protein
VEAAEIPAAPAWPDPAATDLGPGTDAAPGAPEPPAPEAYEPVSGVDQWPPPEEAPARPMPTEPRPDTRARAPVEPRGDGPSGGLPQIDLPFTMPVTLSGWLIGIGAVVAVLGLIVILIGTALNAIDLLLLVGLLGVAATVFLSAQLPAVPHLRLITLVLSLVAFGVALDRVGLRGGGVGELLLFLGSAAAAVGAVILELGQDQPLGRSQP